MHLMHLQRENTVFKFLWRSADGALRTSSGHRLLFLIYKQKVTFYLVTS